jgi:hypothetical protein
MKKYLLKGAGYGFLAFIITFVVVSLINTGKLSISDAFGFSDPGSVFNYILALIFIIIGAGIGLIYKKIKS